MIDIKKFREACQITIACEPETVPYVGNCSSIDPDTDREQEEWIRSELARGNEWAWCWVKVTVEYAGLKASDSLGCCSYKSYADFTLAGGYYDDMVRSCQDDVLRQLREMERAIRAVSKTRKRKP